MQNDLPDYLQTVASKIEEFTNEISRLTKIEEDLSSKLLITENENSKLSQKNTELSHEKNKIVEQSEIDKQGLKEINSTMSEQLRESNNKNNSLGKAGVSASEEVGLLKKEINTLRITSEALREKNNHLEQNHTADLGEPTVTSKDESDEKLLLEIGLVKKELKEALIDKGVLEDQHTQFKELYIKAGEEKIAIASQFKSLNDNNTRLISENKVLSEGKTFLLANKEKIEKINAQLLEEKIVLSKRNEELASNKEIIESKNHALEEDLTQLREQISEFNTSNTELKELTASLENDNKALLQKSKMLADINSNLVSESLAQHD